MKKNIAAARGEAINHVEIMKSRDNQNFLIIAQKWKLLFPLREREMKETIDFIVFIVLLVNVMLYPAYAEDAPGTPEWMPKLLGMQFDGVYQNMPNYHSPYEGLNSLSFQNGRGEGITQTYGIYLGSQLASRLQVYLDAEWFRGSGIGNGVGLGGYTNGDYVRAGSSNLPQDPYVARLYLRYCQPLSGETEKVERGMDQLPGVQAVGRWEVKAGKLAPTDDFDLNRYANNSRTQFLNYDFLFNTAWDYASDTRGYSYGVVASLFQPRWRLALGIYMEPHTANGAEFDFVDTRELGYNLELTLKPNDGGTVFRLLSYFNEGRLGSYDAALALGRDTGTAPNLLLVEGPGGTKYGFVRRSVRW